MLGARCRGDKAEAADGPADWASLRDALKCSMQGLDFIGKQPRIDGRVWK